MSGDGTMTVRRAEGALEFTDDQRRIIRDSFANGASDAEFAVLMEVARTRRLNPIMRQVFFVKRWDNTKKREVWATQVSIDGLRAIAERTGLYAGQDEPEYVHDEKGKLLCAKVKVWRRDWPRPAVGVAYWSEFVQTTRDNNPTRMWQTMPYVMLGKCAESQALRKAFPEDMSGLYSPEEMGQADNDAPQRVEVQRRPDVIEGRALGPGDTEPADDSDTAPASAAIVAFEAALATCPLSALAAEWTKLLDGLRAEKHRPEEWTGAASKFVDDRWPWLTVDERRAAVCAQTPPPALALCDDLDLCTELRGVVSALRTHKTALGPKLWNGAIRVAARRLAALTGGDPATAKGEIAAALDATPQPPPDDGPRGGRPASDEHGAAQDALGDGADLDAIAAAPQALAAVPAWAATEAGIAGYVASKDHPVALENAVRAHGRIAGAHFLTLAAQRLEALTPADEHGARATPAALYATVRRWADEGPRARREQPGRGGKAA